MNEPNLRDVLSDLGIVPIHRSKKGWFVTACPFAEYTHEFGTDRNPSFQIKISPDGFSGYNCFTCSQHGNIPKMIQMLEDYSGNDYNSVLIKASLYETPENFKSWEEAASIEQIEELEPVESELYFKLYPPVEEFPEALKYLQERDICLETANILGLRFDQDEHRILFPVYGYDKMLYGFTGRSILPKSEWPSGRYSKVKDYAGLKKDRTILGEGLIRPELPLLLVEGLFALAHMIEIGVDSFCNPVASMGSHLSKFQRDILISYDQPIFLLYDNDAAGKQGLYGTTGRDGNYVGGGAVDLLKPHVPTYTSIYPDGVTDPDLLTYEDVYKIVLGKKSKME